MKKPSPLMLLLALLTFFISAANAYTAAKVPVREIPPAVLFGGVALGACAWCWHGYWKERDRYREWLSRRPDLEEEKK